jgi:hypothetical protein
VCGVHDARACVAVSREQCVRVAHRCSFLVR